MICCDCVFISRIGISATYSSFVQIDHRSNLGMKAKIALLTMYLSFLYGTNQENVQKILSHIMTKPVYAICEQQKRRQCSLISTFVVRCFYSLIPIVAVRIY